MTMKLSDLDHPCKDTCSGWKQGYERGLTISRLKEIRIYELESLLKRIRTCIKTRYDRPVQISMRLLELVPEMDLQVSPLTLPDIETETKVLNDISDKISSEEI